MKLLSPRKKAFYMELARRAQAAKKKVLLIEIIIFLASSTFVVCQPVEDTDIFPSVIPPAIFEHHGQVFATLEYAFTAFYIPVTDIVDKAQAILDLVEKESLKFSSPDPDLEDLKNELRTLIQSVKIENEAFENMGAPRRSKRNAEAIEDPSRIKREINWNMNIGNALSNQLHYSLNTRWRFSLLQQKSPLF